MRYLPFASLLAVVVVAGHAPRTAVAAIPADDACALLSPADIAKAISWKVGAGTAAPSIPGILGKCTWTAGENARVIVTLSDARHADFALQAEASTGAKPVAGLGTKAVSWPATDLTGGWIVTVEDAKGGFGVSVLSRSATTADAIALAKVVEGRR